MKSNGILSFEQIKRRAHLLPKEMAEAERWVCWRYRGRGGERETKMPIQPKAMPNQYPPFAKSNDPSTWGSFADAVRCVATNPELEIGIGFVLGDGWSGIDLDHVADEDGRLSAPAQSVLTIMDGHGYTEWSPSGDGVHIILKTPKPEGYNSNRALPGEGTGNLEYYGNGRFFTVTLDPLTEVAPTMSPCPQNVGRICEEYLVMGRVPTEVTKPAARPMNYLDGAEAYAKSLIGELIGQGGRNSHMFRICGHLWKKTESRDEVLRWANVLNLSCCQPPLPPAEVETIVDNAKSNGTPPVDSAPPVLHRVYTEEPEVDPEELKVFRENCNARAKGAVPVQKFEQLGGFIGEYLRNYRSKSPEYLPELGIASALNALATLAGGRVELADGSTPNIYTVGLAPSGAGKDFTRKINEDLLKRSGNENRLGPTHLSSGEGFIKLLSVEGVTLFQLDEAAELFAEVKTAGSAVAARIGKFLKEAYSQSGRFWKPNCKADSKTNVVIQYCCPTVYFTTTRGRFWESFSADSIEDGFLGRLFIFQQEHYVESTPGVKRRKATASDRLVQMAEEWSGASNGGNLPPELAGDNRIIVDVADDAYELMERFFEKIDRKALNPRNMRNSALWKRCKDKVVKVAMLLALSREGAACREVTIPDVMLSIELVKRMTYRTIRSTERELLLSDHDRFKVAILRVLDSRGTTPTRELSKHCKGMTRKDRESALNDLRETGEVAEYLDENGVSFLKKMC